jgi:creatinine amidohydrolase
MEMYPAGQLPPASKLSQRSADELEAVLKGPYEPGGKHLYTIAYPP